MSSHTTGIPINPECLTWCIDQQETFNQILIQDVMFIPSIVALILLIAQFIKRYPEAIVRHHKTTKENVIKIHDIMNEFALLILVGLFIYTRFFT